MFRRTLLTFILLLALSIAASHAATGGRVVDENGAPVAGAFIVTTWRGTSANPMDSQTESCYSLLVTRTAPDGTFKIPTSSPENGGFLLKKTSYSAVYVAGYRTASIQPQGGTTRLRRRDEPALETVLTLLSTIPSGCVNPSRVRELAPIFKAIYEDARSLEPSENPRVKNSLFTLKHRYEAASAGVWP